MQKWFIRAGLAGGAAVLAYWAVRLELPLREWAHGRPMLPVIMLLVGTTLLNPWLRTYVIIAMCFGVSFLAIRDSYHIHYWNVPFTMDRSLADAMIRSALLLIASLSVIAGILETITPGSVWARRIYFGATAVYCTGLGIRYFGAHGSLQSVVLCGTGITALFACVFVHRIVANEADAQFAHLMSDEAEQRLRDDEHLRTLRDKEWQVKDIGLPSSTNA